MNEIEKAISDLKNAINSDCLLEFPKSDTMRISVNALQKQIPVPPTAPQQGYRRCPSCNAGFIEELGTTNYCGNCGQALNWEDN